MSTADPLAATREAIEHATVQMRSQVAAFRRTAMPEIKSSYLRITAELGREEPFVTNRLGESGVRELIDEVQLLAWDIPQALDELFGETWIQGCFLANGSWPNDLNARVYDYIRNRKMTESPFPAYFARQLNEAFRPLGRLLVRSGFKVRGDPREQRTDEIDPEFTYPRIVARYRMNPSLVSGAVLFGEQARRCYELREKFDVLEYGRMRDEAKRLWNVAQGAREAPPVVTAASRPPFATRRPVAREA